MVQSLPQVVVLDVNETLSDLGQLRSEFAAVGAPPELAAAWFAATLRDGFALTSAGTTAAFADLAQDALRAVLHGRAGLTTPPDEAVERIMAAFSQLPTHPDVPIGLTRLRDAGLRIVTLTNGATSVADGLLRRSGVRDTVEQLLSVEAIGIWKPAKRPYLYAAEQTGCEPGELMLVAAHPWDIDGAHRAGLRTVYVDRTRTPYPREFSTPDLTVRDFVALAEQLSG